MKHQSIVVGIYGHPAFYPPTLNAINLLANQYEKVYLVFRNIEVYDWVFPENVVLCSSGRRYPIRELERQSILKKIAAVILFARILLRIIKKARPKLLLVYDPLIWLPLSVIKPFLPSGLKIWYHNHDVADPLYLKKYSLFGFAVKAEQKYFTSLDYFSLPSLDRRKYFPMQEFRGEFFFLPNYPSSYLFNQFNDQKKSSVGPVTLLYQGSIGPQHGFEEIIPLLGNCVHGRTIEMELIGYVEARYKQILIDLAKSCGTEKFLHIKPPMPYMEVVKNAQHCHIGLAIYCKKDVMNSTIGTASNKIYEYAASGMPVLLYDSIYFKDALGLRRWALFTDLSKNSLLGVIDNAMQQFNILSESALRDFRQELCFEKYFEQTYMALQ